MNREITALVLAAGRGKRMESKIQKQYMEVDGHPLLYYALKAFQNSAVDRIVLVTGAGEEAFCQKEIVELYGFTKVSAIVPGGKERYHSVYEGLKAAEGSRIVLIHDGARPCVRENIIGDAIEGARQFGACVVGMPVKDTIKMADQEGFAAATPDRSRLWAVQTPQAFSYEVVRNAYDRLMSDESLQIGITDDAMVVETLTSHRVKLIPGSYENIKVTTPEDLILAAEFLKN